MIWAVVLAAGRSRRMGTQKLLLPFAGSTVLGHIVDQLAGSSVAGTLVVVGPEHADIQAALTGRPIRFAANPAVESEMLDSLRCGLRALPEDCRGFLVCLGDQPGISPELVGALMEAFESAGGGVVAPLHAGRRGHPVLIGMEHRDRILAQYDDVGLRGLLRDPEVRVTEVPWRESLEDLDSPEDYRRAVGTAGA